MQENRSQSKATEHDYEQTNSINTIDHVDPSRSGSMASSTQPTGSYKASSSNNMTATAITPNKKRDRQESQTFG